MANLVEQASAFLKERGTEVPDSLDEILNLYFGAYIVGKLDYWLERANDYMDNPEPKEPYARPDSVFAQSDRAYRDAFCHMDEEQKMRVKKLLKESAEGVLFSTFLLFDQPPAGNWKISIEGKDGKALLTKYKALHEDFYKWVQLFSNA